ncbi:alpha-amylase family glycosyl hydrolase [Verrucomicrobium sp. GAS474]|uniref:alpha-amylase family glycosyl hydrolase n=1 Tax=Verrucomicrobium sp. GAS474 TaxID=1882831 RepID=UPI0018D485A1|nr:alpha-amylase family glycosyl hydrolase [Verrucomicrobium sp. GAS474]
MPSTPYPAETDVLLRVSDAEFRSETIYFIVVDRFLNGAGPKQGLLDPTLDDLEHKDWRKYWGGDLQGVIDKLDYLQAMGVTAIWCTPLFEQVEGMFGGNAPMHGYWAQDFKKLNSRWVNQPDEVHLFSHPHTVFDELLDQLHRRGMKFILDIVCNHSNPETPNGKGKLYDDGKLVADFNDDKDHWYHHYGEVTNWQDDWQVKNCELAGLATFNENNILYRRYIVETIKAWLDRGVDSLRIDTVKHMPLWFWQEVTSEWQFHKPDLFIFGEWYASDPEVPESVEFANKSGMTTLDFGLCYAVRAALAQNHPDGFGAVQQVFEKGIRYRGANELVTFCENHDMPRFQSLGASDATHRLAHILLMTCRGIPCIYYGAEQYLHNDTDGGEDPYNRPMMSGWAPTEMTRVLKILSDERKHNPAIQWGAQRERYVTKDLFAFTRVYRDSRCFTLLNKGGEVTVPRIETSLSDGLHRCLLTGRELTVRDGAIENVSLAAQEAIVLSWIGQVVTGKTVIHLQLNGIHTQPGERIAVIGNCPELGEWDLSRAVPLDYVNGTTWFGQLVFEASAGITIAYKFVLFADEGIDQPRRENRTTRRRPLPYEGMAKWRDVWES